MRRVIIPYYFDIVYNFLSIISISTSFLPFPQKTGAVFVIFSFTSFSCHSCKIPVKMDAQLLAHRNFCNLIFPSHLITFFLHNFRIIYRYKVKHRQPEAIAGAWYKFDSFFFIFFSPLLHWPACRLARRFLLFLRMAASRRWLFRACRVSCSCYTVGFSRFVSGSKYRRKNTEITNLTRWKPGSHFWDPGFVVCVV